MKTIKIIIKLFIIIWIVYYSKKPNTKTLDKLYQVTSCLEKDYLNHKNWFYNKFSKELDGKRREIIYFEEDSKICGVVFLKNTEEEKKICTLYIKEEYRKQGIGTKLILESIKFLGTTKPLITMPEYKENCFKKIINKYKWEKTQEIENCYSKNKELVFNGMLDL